MITLKSRTTLVIFFVLAVVTVVAGATASGAGFTVTVTPESSTTWYAGYEDEGYQSESADPLAPFAGQSVMFKGWTREGGATEMREGAYLVCRYKIEFDHDVAINSVSVTGAGDHTSLGNSAVLRLLDQNQDEIAVEPLMGFNELKTHTVTTGGVCGRTFYMDEFDYSTYYRYRKYVAIDYATIVEIDVKPGADPNPINPRSKGLVPVAILSSGDFDARTVDKTTVELAGARIAVRGKNKFMAHEEDVNGDGFVDLVVQVETQGLSELGEGGTVKLTGTTSDGKAIVGYDGVVIVPS